MFPNFPLLQERGPPQPFSIYHRIHVWYVYYRLFTYIWLVNIYILAHMPVFYGSEISDMHKIPPPMQLSSQPAFPTRVSWKCLSTLAPNHRAVDFHRKKLGYFDISMVKQTHAPPLVKKNPFFFDDFESTGLGKWLVRWFRQISHLGSLDQIKAWWSCCVYVNTSCICVLVI